MLLISTLQIQEFSGPEAKVDLKMLISKSKLLKFRKNMALMKL